MNSAESELTAILSEQINKYIEKEMLKIIKNGYNNMNLLSKVCLDDNTNGNLDLDKKFYIKQKKKKPTNKKRNGVTAYDIPNGVMYKTGDGPNEPICVPWEMHESKTVVGNFKNSKKVKTKYAVYGPDINGLCGLINVNNNMGI